MLYQILRWWIPSFALVLGTATSVCDLFQALQNTHVMTLDVLVQGDNRRQASPAASRLLLISAYTTLSNQLVSDCPSQGGEVDPRHASTGSSTSLIKRTDYVNLSAAKVAHRLGFSCVKREEEKGASRSDHLRSAQAARQVPTHQSRAFK